MPETFVPHAYTIETVIDDPSFDRQQFSREFTDFNAIVHRATFDLQNGSDMKELKNKSHYQTQFSADARMVNSALKTAKGRIEAGKELAKTQIKQRAVKIKALREQIFKMKKKATENNYFNATYPRAKRFLESIYQKQCKLNRLVQKNQTAQERLDQGKVKLCYGTRKVFKGLSHPRRHEFKHRKQALYAYQAQRNNQVVYVGAQDETAGNLKAQLTYHMEDDTYSLKVRKGLKYSTPEDKYYVIRHLKIKYQQDRLNQILREHTSPLTIRIIRMRKKNRNRYYL